MLKVSQSPVHQPADLAGALSLRAAHPEAMPLAGGTDVMVVLEAGHIDPPAFLNLWGLAELSRIEDADDGGLWIGALCTYTQIEEDPRVSAVAPTLVEAAFTVGARQIQNRGTLGGNIANGSPAGDTLPVLLALDAVVEMQSAARGARRVPMGTLYTGYRALDLAADELITRVYLPPPHPADHTHFRKVGTRLAQSISKVMMAGRVRIEDEIITEARVAFGSVAATPVRCPTVEAALLGAAPDGDAALEALEHDIQPIDDVRSSADYRKNVARRILRSWLETL